jgi:hypothetical protein
VSRRLSSTPVVAAAIVAAIALVTRPSVPVLAQGAGEGWVIERLHADFMLGQDGVIDVREAFDVDFRALRRHGILRDVVAMQSYNLEYNRRYLVGGPAGSTAHGPAPQGVVPNLGANPRVRNGAPDREIYRRQT